MVQEKLTGVKYAHEKSFTKYQEPIETAPLSALYS